MDVENYWRVIGSERRPPGLLELIGGVVKVGGHPNRFNHGLAVRHADRPTADIVAELRDHADSRKLSPPTTAPNLAFDILVHGQDISIPLGLSRPMPRVAAGAGATRVWGMGFPFWARRRLRGYRLTATDIEWPVGAGAEVRSFRLCVRRDGDDGGVTGAGRGWHPTVASTSPGHGGHGG